MALICDTAEGRGGSSVPGVLLRTRSAVWVMSKGEGYDVQEERLVCSVTKWYKESSGMRGECNDEDERINKHSGLKNTKVLLERPDAT